MYIPGVDKNKIKSYYPPLETWECAPPGSTNVEEDVLAKDVIPVFPDDPKARLLDDLRIDEQLCTTTLSQFWALMEHRQECSSGRLVGFISTTFPKTRAIDRTEDGVVVDEKNFTRAFDMLLNGDYSSDENALGATTRWLESVLAVVPKEMKEKWGFELVPTGKEDAIGEGVKKRPAEDVKPVNLLGGMLIRKKPKTQV